MTDSDDTPEVAVQPQRGPDDASDSLGELAGAMAKAQADVQEAHKSHDNPFFKSTYADLASVWDACRDALSANNLAVIQTTEPGDAGQVVIVTTMIHSSGEWIRGRLAVRPDKQTAQSLGSAITYGRRYALSAIAGVAPSDDDGNEASANSHKKVEVPALDEVRPSLVEESPPAVSSDTTPPPSLGEEGAPKPLGNPASDKQVGYIHVLLDLLEMDDADYRYRLDELYGVRTSKDLTTKQANELIDKLKASGAERGIDMEAKRK